MAASGADLLKRLFQRCLDERVALGEMPATDPRATSYLYARRPFPTIWLVHSLRPGTEPLVIHPDIPRPNRITSLVENAPEGDHVKECTIVAHELGHHLVGATYSDPDAHLADVISIEDRAAHGEPIDKSEADRLFGDETAAWERARLVLAQLGWVDWTRFAEVRHCALASYVERITGVLPEWSPPADWAGSPTRIE